MRQRISRSWRAVCMALAATLVLVAAGCAFHTGTETEFNGSGKPLRAADLAGKKVWVRSFSHSAVTGVSTAYATGSGGTASGVGVTRSTFRQAPQFVINALQDAELFDSVTPVGNLGKKPDLLLEGRMNCRWRMPWWTWVQLADLWIHAWLFPTLGRDHIVDGEIHLYDTEYRRLHTWSYQYTKRWCGNIWWAMSHGGAYDTGSEGEIQPEVAQWIFDQVRKDIGAGVAGTE